MDLVWVAVGTVACAVLVRSMRDVLAAPVLQRTNYRGNSLATAGGVVAVVAFLVTMGAFALVDADGSSWQVSCVVAVAGFGLIGLFDDLVGSHSARGLRGHLRMAMQGKLTSGATKLVAGVAVAAVAVVPFGVDFERRLLATVVVAGAANVANLFDLAPGRLSKVALPVGVALGFAAGSVEAVLGPLVFLAAIAVLARHEFAETLMLGDTGANPVGAAVGLLALAAADGDRAALYAAAGFVVAINLAGELVSFSRVIDRVPPLRFVDRLGRRA